jgi:hypothetical protein
MTQDSVGENEARKRGAPDSSHGNAPSHRRVARTLLDVDSPELKKIRDLLKTEETKGKKVSNTLVDAPLPQIKKARQVPTHEAKPPAIEHPKPNQGDTAPSAESNAIATSNTTSKPKRFEQTRDFYAKTMLDSEVLSDVLKKYAARKSELAAKEAEERAAQPVVEFHPVKGNKRAQACSWRWDDHSSTERFRYCPNCKIQAYNFDGLELKEAEALVFKRENKRNQTLYERADGKFMTQDCPVQVAKRKKFVLFSVVAAIALLAVLAMAILVPSPARRPTFAATESADEQSQIAAPEEDANDATTAEGADFEVPLNADGTRKRPTFGPEDVNSYWE